MIEHGDILEEGKDLLQDDMTFRLDYQQGSEKKDDDPMWASASSSPADWFFADEGS
ncbi:MAG: hypothetical protein M1461_04370 [Nitrospirae bacterium]|nr:hypothetical protein [Nitrospirota bacterium]